MEKEGQKGQTCTEDKKLDEAHFDRTFQECGFGKTSQEKKWLKAAFHQWTRIFTATGSEEAVYNSIDSVLSQIRNPADLLQYRIVATDDVTKEEDQFCVGPTHTQEASDDSSGNHPKHKCNNLQRRHLILIGWLSSSLPAVQGPRHASWSLTDGTGSIPCLICSKLSSKVLMLLDSWVMVTSWNVVQRSNKRNAIEISCLKAIGKSPKTMIEKEKFDVLSAEDGRFLLDYKEVLKPDCINIIGEVVAVSERMRIKKDVIFCIQLSHNVHILVKTPEFMHWQDVLTPQKEFVFVNLRPTTLQKGAGDVHKVYVPRHNSRLFTSASLQCEQLSLQDWFKANSIEENVHKELLARRGTRSENDEELRSYQGVVTDTKLAKYGLYELDHKVGLSLCSIPTTQTYESLRVGTKVAVYNAHIKGCRKAPKIRILCCAASCVKVMEFSNLDMKLQPVCLPFNLQRLLWKHGINKEQMDSLINAVIALNMKFKLTKHSVADLLLALLGLYNREADWSDGQRNFLGECLSTPHTCCFTRQNTCGKGKKTTAQGRQPDGEKQNSTDILFPEILTIPDIETISMRSEPRLNMGKGNIETGPNANNLNDSVYWQYAVGAVRPEDRKTSVGEIHLSVENGKVQLRDQTGTLNCIITNQSRNELQCAYSDDAKCERLKFNHGNLDPVLNGQLIALDRYYIIHEKFQVGDHASSESYGSKQDIECTRDEKYVVFDQADAAILKPQTDIVDDCDGQSRKKVKEDEKRRGDNSGSVQEVIYIKYKEGMIVEGMYSSNPKLRFTAEGHVLDPDIDDKDIHDFIIRQWKNDHDDVTAKDSRMRTASTARQVDKEKKSSSKIFLFQGSAVRWYDLIEPGSVYRVNSPAKSSEVFMKATTWQLKRAVEKADGRACVIFAEDIILENTCVNYFCDLIDCACKGQVARAHLSTVEDILSDRCESSLVSFVGLVTSRKHSDLGPHTNKGRNLNKGSINLLNKKLCVSTLCNRQIQLRVRCLQSKGEITLYLNLEGMSYLLGLLPGAVVQFNRLERKVPQNGGPPYCQYIVVSTIKVLQIEAAVEKGLHCSSLEEKVKVMNSDQCHDSIKEYKMKNWANMDPMNCQICPDIMLISDDREMAEKQSVNWSDSPVKYLMDVLDNGTTPFQCQCHIQRVLKISLKCVCDTCHGLLVDKCENVSCSSTAGVRFVTRASCMVDDGTCVGVASFSGDIVQQLFELSDKQWSCIADQVKSYGEVFIQKGNFAENSSLEKFVALLCDNPQIKKPRRMLFSCLNLPRQMDSDHLTERWQPSYQDIQKMSIEEFALRTIDTGLERVETRCVPLVQLQCLGIQHINYTTSVSEILNKTEN